jgi:hypothetical protein
MRRLSIAVLTSLVCYTAASNLGAQTVIQNSNLLLGPGSFGGENYTLTVYQNAAATDPTSVFGIYNRPTIQVTNTNIDEGSDWYVVRPGDRFDAAHIQAGAFTRLIEVPNTPGAPLFYPAANVGQSDFWLGVATGKALFGPRTVFGWLQLRPLSNTQLMMVENVVSYDSPGIIVGTTTLVPEPGAIALSGLGVLLMATRRPRRK